MINFFKYHTNLEELYGYNVPYMIDHHGTKHWYLNGKIHREDGPACEGANGTKEWFLNGKIHREDGPAVEGSHGSKGWYLNGKCHRVDGPAVELYDGIKEWWLNNQKYSFEEWKEERKKYL